MGEVSLLPYAKTTLKLFYTCPFSPTLSPAQLHPTFEESVGYTIRSVVEIEYVSRIPRRLITPEEAPEPFASEARKVGKTLEREWLRRAK